MCGLKKFQTYKISLFIYTFIFLEARNFIYKTFGTYKQQVLNINYIQNLCYKHSGTVT